MTTAELKTLLNQYHFGANKTYGQNFLLNDSVLKKMVETAKLTKNDAVLEIGPGIGNLTKELLENAKFVLSVEKDPKFLLILKSLKKQYKNFRYEIADVLKFDFQKELSNLSSRPKWRDPSTSSRQVDTTLGMTLSYKVVANIPYFITGKIIKVLLAAKFKPKSITMLVQKEVAQNIVAAPGKLNLLAISVQLYGKPVLAEIVRAADFYPAPKVDSAILHIELYQKQKYDIADEKKFFGILHACFAGKRKQLHNTLVNNLKLDKNEVSRILQQLNINPAARPQELKIQQWIDLANEIKI